LNQNGKQKELRKHRVWWHLNNIPATNLNSITAYMCDELQASLQVLIKKWNLRLIKLKPAAASGSSKL
jgi:hypothetical protein